MWRPNSSGKRNGPFRTERSSSTKAFARELGPRKIRVNVVAPGYTDTEGNKGLVGSQAGDALIAATPLGNRFGQPEEIAPAVVFLASDDAAWLTGERLNASGGVH